MRLPHLLPAAVTALLLSGCTKEVDESKLVVRGGLRYEVNSETPYSGKATLKWPNGQLKYEATYKDGKLEWPWRQWYENGQPVEN